MDNYNEVGKIIIEVLKRAAEENLTLWIVEEETGESIKLYNLLNCEKNIEDAIFKKTK